MGTTCSSHMCFGGKCDTVPHPSGPAGAQGATSRTPGSGLQERGLAVPVIQKAAFALLSLLVWHRGVSTLSLDVCRQRFAQSEAVSSSPPYRREMEAQKGSSVCPPSSQCGSSQNGAWVVFASVLDAAAAVQGRPPQPVGKNSLGIDSLAGFFLLSVCDHMIT